MSSLCVMLWGVGACIAASTAACVIAAVSVSEMPFDASKFLDLSNLVELASFGVVYSGLGGIVVGAIAVRPKTAKWNVIICGAAFVALVVGAIMYDLIDGLANA